MFVCLLLISMSLASGSSSGLHPTVDVPKLDAEILRDARALNRYPKRVHKAVTDEEKREESLAKRLRNGWNDLLPSTREELEAMKRRHELLTLDVEVLTEVHNLGRYPQRKNNCQLCRETRKCFS